MIITNENLKKAQNKPLFSHNRNSKLINIKDTVNVKTLVGRKYAQRIG
jgi:hypothetical protein